MEMLKVKVSGSFKTVVGTDKDRCNYAGVEGLIPAHDWEWHTSHAMRLFPIWLIQDKRYKDVNFEGIIKLYVDSVEEAGEVKGEPICMHKDIKEMTWEELQSLACAYKLREIPLYRRGDLRNAREKAYERYEAQVNGKRVFKQVKQLKDWRKEQEERGLSEVEIESMLEKSLNMVVDPERPDKSYNFAKLPKLYVGGKGEKKQPDTLLK